MNPCVLSKHATEIIYHNSQHCTWKGSPVTHHTHTTHTHTHTHTGFYGLRGLSIGVMVFILYKAVYAIALHLNLALTGDVHFYFPSKNSLCMIYKRLNYGDTENILINHLVLVIPMLYPCHYTNLCPHNHINMPTHTHTHTTHHTHHTHTHTTPPT